ncbi:helix-turn-helix domain-containing protein [Paragemmobacter straminiformis]|uniref:Helix-turn-helix transcriptional regulator n=1 Tax=Paragemmobacter straminiformis TaxID=2045119 RepID=A0A842I301_9RHOB|nr:XRE family transcriptional regulator [Gemmobacter straminiformis]MBC2834562.1 helix-turn-helix transcriptional regulator [Gemmobacter straminiformis]
MDQESTGQDTVEDANWAEEREKLRADLGQRMKALRQDCGLTLEGAAIRTGLALSTIHKIENGRVSPSYENLVRVARGYGVGIERLLSAEDGTNTAKTRMTVTRAGTGGKVRTASYEYEVLCTALSEKKIIPLVATIDRRGKLGPKDLGAHDGEECIYVLSGRVELQVEHYAPVELGVGDCAYYDSTLKHAIRALDDTETRIFWTSTDDAFTR